MHDASNPIWAALARAAAILLLVVVSLALAEGLSFAVLIVKRDAILSIYDYDPRATSLVGDDYVLPTKHNISIPWKTGEFDIRVKLNSGGYRENFDFDLAELDIAFLGDSFTFGQGVNVEDRYSNVFSRHVPGLKVAALAYRNGYEPEQYEYFLKRNPRLRPKKVVIGLYLGNDLESDVRETVYDPQANTLSLPYWKVDERGDLIIAPRVYKRWIRPLVEHSNMAKLFVIVLNHTRYRDLLFAKDSPVPNAPNSPRLEKGEPNELAIRSLDSLGRVNTYLKGIGSELIVLIIPENFYVGSTSNPHIDPELKDKIPEVLSGDNLRKYVVFQCAARELYCLDSTEILDRRDYFEWDAHWNVAGHRKVGDWLASTLQRR